MISLRISILSLGLALVARPAFATKSFECGDYPNLTCSVGDDRIASSGHCVAAHNDSDSDETRLIKKIEDLSGGKYYTPQLKAMIASDKNMGALAHEYGHIFARTWKRGNLVPVIFGNETYLQQYISTVKNPCRFTGRTHLTSTEYARGSEFAEVFAAYLTNPRLLDNGDPACKEAKDFIRKEVLYAKDVACDGGYPLIDRQIAAEEKPLPGGEEEEVRDDCETPAAEVLDPKQQKDLSETAQAIELAAKTKEQAAAEAKANAEANARVDAQIAAEEKAEEKRAEKRRREREAEKSAQKWKDGITSVAMVLTAATPPLLIGYMQYQQAEEQRKYINSLSLNTGSTSTVVIQTAPNNAVYAPNFNREVQVIPTQPIPVVPGDGTTGGTGR